MRKRLLFAAALVALLPAFATETRAATATGIGPRVGFSVDPDQLVMGGHLVVGDVAPHLTFNPNLELGLGDDVTVIAVNFDMHYHLTLESSNWVPYFGAGLGVVFAEQDRPGPDDSETDVGGSVVMGAGVPTRSDNIFFGEMRFGLGSGMPSLKLIAGWTFKI